MVRYYKVYRDNCEFYLKNKNEKLLELFHNVDCDSYNEEVELKEGVDCLNDFNLCIMINDEIYKRYDDKDLSWNKHRKSLTRKILKIMSGIIMENESKNII